MRSALVDRPIEPSDLLTEVARTSNGATVLFVGTVREVNEGRPVAGIEYSALIRNICELALARAKETVPADDWERAQVLSGVAARRPELDLFTNTHAPE